MLFLEYKDTLNIELEPVDSLFKILQFLHFKRYNQYTLDKFITKYNQIDAKTIREFCKDLGSIMFENVPVEFLQWLSD